MKSGNKKNGRHGMVTRNINRLFHGRGEADSQMCRLIKGKIPVGTGEREH